MSPELPSRSNIAEYSEADLKRAHGIIDSIDQHSVSLICTRQQLVAQHLVPIKDKYEIDIIDDVRRQQLLDLAKETTEDHDKRNLLGVEAGQLLMGRVLDESITLQKEFFDGDRKIIYPNFELNDGSLQRIHRRLNEIDFGLVRNFITRCEAVVDYVIPVKAGLSKPAKNPDRESDMRSNVSTHLRMMNIGDFVREDFIRSLHDQILEHSFDIQSEQLG